MPFTGLLIGGGLMGAKSLLLDAPRANRQRKQEAEIAKYSPWTGMSPQRIQEADPFGAALQGGTTGAMLGQGIDQMGQQDALNKKFGDYLDRSGWDPSQVDSGMGRMRLPGRY